MIRKITMIVLMSSGIFLARYVWSLRHYKTPQEQRQELDMLKKSSGASFVNYQYTVKEPKNKNPKNDSVPVAYPKKYEDLWTILRNMNYDMKNGYYTPLFSVSQEQLNDQKIALKGFMIPMQETTKQHFFLLSYFPYSMCFFCGNAEPQTVIEVYSKSAINWQPEPVLVEGILRLNKHNPEKLFYSLEDARVMHSEN